MKILVTGLCLSGNKGGPALGLSLQSVLAPLLPGAEFVFSFPRDADESLERAWAQRFGVSAVRECRPRELLLGAVSSGRHEWTRTLASADLVVDLSGIAYVSPPLVPLKVTLTQARARFFAASMLYRRPFLAWTQSYGPFDHPAVAAAARADLGRLPVVFCRGARCAAAVRELLPGKTLMQFPDVATTMPALRSPMVDSVLAGGGELVTLSPSAVLCRRRPGEGPESHIGYTADACRRLLALGLRVVLVPHNVIPSRPAPEHCDLAVARRVQALAPGVECVDGDHDPRELKAIIAASAAHVGARYHSLVAALSSGVPTLCLSWHPKYRDLFEEFGESTVIDDDGPDVAARLTQATLQLIAQAPETRQRLHAAGESIQRKVRINAEVFAGLARTVGP